MWETPHTALQQSHRYSLSGRPREFLAGVLTTPSRSWMQEMKLLPEVMFVALEIQSCCAFTYDAGSRPLPSTFV